VLKCIRPWVYNIVKIYLILKKMINKKFKFISVLAFLVISILNFSIADTTWDSLSGSTTNTWTIETTTWDINNELPQILINEETNTIYVTWYQNESTGENSENNNETWSVENEETIEDTIIELPDNSQINPEDEFDSALSWMYENWLTMYDNKTDYRPYDPLTREEASKIIGQAYSVLWYQDVTKNASCTFSDSENFNPTLSKHIWNVCKRWLFKWADGRFMPKETLTKAQSMAVLMRMFEWKMSYELQIPWRTQYYEKWKIIWLTNVDNINEFDHELTRYEIALMIYRLKNIATNEQLKTMALNAIWNIVIPNKTWSMNSETVIDNLDTLVGWIDPNSDPELLEAIYWMFENWLTIYSDPNNYKPFEVLNRAGAAKIFDKFSDMLWLWTTEAYLPNDCIFTDISHLDESTQTHVSNVCKKWLIKWGNSLFNPDESMNKSQFVVALIRMFEWKHLDENVSPRWQNYFNEAKSLGLVSPSDAVTFDNPISRYEVALFLYKFDIKYKMLNTLNNNRISNEVISTVKWSISTWTNWKIEANVYVDANLLNDWKFNIWYVEIFGTRYKIVKTSEETYFADNFVRYGDIFDMVTEERLGSVNFIVSNGYVIESVIRFVEWKNYKIKWVEWTSAYYKINEQ